MKTPPDPAADESRQRGARFLAATPSTARGPLPSGLHAIALTRPGARTAARIAAGLPGTRAWAPARFAAEAGVDGFDEPVADRIARLWPGAGGFLLVMAAGIAVRAIAPLLRDKTVDPAVVVLDPGGRFAVPLLSGHLGGGNDLARAVAERLGGRAVITTATDAAGRPAVEVWARQRGWKLCPRSGVVRVNAAWASGEPVAAWVDPLAGGPEQVAELAAHLERVLADPDEVRAFPGAVLAVTPRLAPGPWADLVVHPRCLALGVGCRRNATPGVVTAGVRRSLEDAGLSPAAVAVVASADLKADEPALHRLARDLDVRLVTFPSERLAAVPVPTPSARVAQATGTPSVAEAAAVLASGGGQLVAPKVKGTTWTLAVAAPAAFRPPGAEPGATR